LIHHFLYGSFANGGKAISDDTSFAPPSAPEDNSELAQARRLLENGQLEQCRAVIANYWLQNPYEQGAVVLFSDLVKALGREEVAAKLDNFAAKLSGSLSPYKYHQEIFEAGYALVEICQHELAAMLLKELQRELPDDPLVNYELGFSLMSLKRFKEARKYFALAVNAKEDFDAMLNLCVCETLERNLEGARRLIKELTPLAQSEEEKLELAHRKIVLARLESLGSKKQLNSRDWLYALYGSILLRPGLKSLKSFAPAAGKIDAAELKDDVGQVASMLVILRGLLTGLALETEGVEYYSLRSRPISNALSQLMEVDYDAYRGPDRPDQVILLMCWTTDILGPHAAFIENSMKRSLFAYGLSPVAPLPIVPDIIGCLAYDVVMPWESKHQEPSNKDTALITKQIYARACDLESDPTLLRETQEAVDYYLEKRHLLVLNNPEAFPNRPEYTAELPELPDSPEI
jgi:tetratricopeptide (TPR) repeat protein